MWEELQEESLHHEAIAEPTQEMRVKRGVVAAIGCKCSIFGVLAEFVCGCADSLGVGRTPLIPPVAGGGKEENLLSSSDAEGGCESIFLKHLNTKPRIASLPDVGESI